MSDSKTSHPITRHSLVASGLKLRTYEGWREEGIAEVTVEGDPLDPRFDLSNHSPNEFEWGYGGSGPAQLALALLADHIGSDEEAVRLHQEFKWAVAAKLPHSRWTLTSAQIADALRTLAAEAPAAPQGCPNP